METKLIVPACVALGFAAGFLVVRGQLADPEPVGAPVVFGVAEVEEHRVTPEMRADSAAKAAQDAPGFRAVAHDGRAFDLGGATAGGPALLLFIKDGCPCSASAEPFYHRLHDRYGDRATFLGVIDGGPEVAGSWAALHGTPFPVLADPDREIIRAFEIPNSAYAALIDRAGTIVEVWPGYSRDILRSLSERLAEHTGTPEARIDVAEAPESPYSGCPFDLD